MWLIEGCVTACTHFEAMSSHLAVLQSFLAVYFVCFSFLFRLALGLPGFFWLLLFPNKINSVISFSPHLHKHLGWHNVENGAKAGAHSPRKGVGRSEVIINFYYQIWVKLQSCSTRVVVRFLFSHSASLCGAQQCGQLWESIWPGGFCPGQTVKLYKEELERQEIQTAVGGGTLLPLCCQWSEPKVWAGSERWSEQKTVQKVLSFFLYLMFWTHSLWGLMSANVVSRGGTKVSLWKGNWAALSLLAAFKHQVSLTSMSNNLMFPEVPGNRNRRKGARPPPCVKKHGSAFISETYEDFSLIWNSTFYE